MTTTTEQPLRDYQQTSIDRLRGSLAEGKRRLVLQSPTGSGKTRIASAIIGRALAKDKRVLFTVPALSLVDQTVEAFYAQGIEDVGVIQAHHHMTDWSKPVQVASVQTLQRREMPKSDIVLIDECHVFFRFYENLLLGSDRRDIPHIGLSATPWTKGLGKYYEELIVAGTTADLIERGILSRFRVFAPSHPDLKGVRTVAGDYHEGDLGEAMNKAKLTADIVQTWIAKGEGRPTICFAVNRAHAKALSEQFEAAGIHAGYMDCDTSVDERKAIRAAFLRGDIRIVCNVDVIGMGVDWPEVSCVVYARPTKSEMRFVQHIGRSLRIAPGKTDTIILDHSDTHLRLGMVTDIGYQNLNDGKPREVTDPAPRLPKECPSCHYLKPPRTAVCPSCGFKCELHAKPIVPKAGHLAELKGGNKNRAKSTEQFTDKAGTYAQLLYYATQHGYKIGWAANKYRGIFGVWPRGIDGIVPEPPLPELVSWIKSTQIRWAKGQGRNFTPQDRKARDEAIIAKVRDEFVPGTLCTQQDLDDFR